VSRDEAALRSLVDDRVVSNSSRGTTSGTDALIQNVRGMQMTGQTVRQRSVLAEGDVAFVSGSADLRFGGPGRAESVSTLRYTSTFVKQQGHGAGGPCR
jgi:ketosteroid isomerase-like protein